MIRGEDYADFKFEARTAAVCSLVLNFLGLYLLCADIVLSGCTDQKRIYAQIAATLLGWFCVWGLQRIHYRTLLYKAPVLFCFGLFFLLFVVLFGIGKAQTGANSWLRFGSFGIQPSEPIKVIFIIVFAYLADLQNIRRTLTTKKGIIFATGCFFLFFVLLLLQNDTGTALVYFSVFFVMYWVGGIQSKHILCGGIICALAAIPVFLLVPQYQKERLLVFLNPARDLSGAGYQVARSKTAIASGGFWGRGVLSSPITRFHLLPETNTDFIFSSIGEMFGFVGTALVCCLLFSLIFSIFFAAYRFRDPGGKLILYGIGTYFFVHTAENLAMTVGLMPVTGIPLPYVSYGGSALLTNYLMLGLFLCVIKRKGESYL